MRDSEIELRPAQLPRPPVLGSEEQCKHGDNIGGMGDRGLAAGLQTRAAHDPSVFIITEKAPTRATYTMFRCLAEVVS